MNTIPNSTSSPPNLNELLAKVLEFGISTGDQIRICITSSTMSWESLPFDEADVRRLIETLLRSSRVTSPQAKSSSISSQCETSERRSGCSELKSIPMAVCARLTTLLEPPPVASQVVFRSLGPEPIYKILRSPSGRYSLLIEE